MNVKSIYLKQINGYPLNPFEINLNAKLRLTFQTFMQYNTVCRVPIYYAYYNNSYPVMESTVLLLFRHEKKAKIDCTLKLRLNT